METVSERQVVESYIKQFALEDCLDEAINDVVEKRPPNPYVAIARSIEAKTHPEILSIDLVPIIIGNGRCGVCALVYTNIDCFKAYASFPSEVPEGTDILRDFTVVKEKLKEEFVDANPCDIARIDEILCSVHDLDSPISLAISMACCRAGARHQGLRLFEFLADLSNNRKSMRLPMPMGTLVRRSVTWDDNGKLKSTRQHISAMTTSATTLEGSIEALLKAGNAINQQLQTMNTIRGFWSGSPNVQVAKLDVLLEMIHRTLKEEAVEGQLKLGVDCSCYALGVRREDGDNVSYDYAGLSENNSHGGHGLLKTNEMVDLCMSWIRQFDVISLEDFVMEEDAESVKTIKTKINHIVAEAKHGGAASVDWASLVSGVGGDSNCSVQWIADAPCLDADFILKSTATSDHLFNAAKVRLSKFSTVSQCLRLVQACQAKFLPVVVAGEENGWNENEDTFFVDLSVAMGASQIEVGGLVSAEGYGKLNRLLEISREDPDLQGSFLGKRFRKCYSK